MSGLEQDAREALRKWAGDLGTLRQELLALHGRLPVSPRADLMLLGEEDADLPTELRRFIECVLGDRIDPLIEDLLATAADIAAPSGGRTEPC